MPARRFPPPPPCSFSVCLILFLRETRPFVKIKKCQATLCDLAGLRLCSAKSGGMWFGGLVLEVVRRRITLCVCCFIAGTCCLKLPSPWCTIFVCTYPCQCVCLHLSLEDIIYKPLLRYIAFRAVFATHFQNFGLLLSRSQTPTTSKFAT